MTELTDKDVINIALVYYGKKFSANDTARVVASLSRADVIGLVKYAYDKGYQDAYDEHTRLRVNVNVDTHTRLMYLRMPPSNIQKEVQK